MQLPLTAKRSVLLAFLLRIASTVRIEPDNAFSLGPLSYRSLAISPRQSALYVGARAHLFRLWLFNLNDTSSTALFAQRELAVLPEEREECMRLGNTERECDFWVRQVFLRSDGNLLLCASQAMKPQLGVWDGQSLAEVEPPRTQIGICSPHDGLNTTAVYTESGNPGDLPALYSGIRTGLSLENHLIYRPPLMRAGREEQPALRTSLYDSNWLNDPQFVGSFSAGPHVFFFFRESLPADCFNCPSAGTGRGATVSRVARICKSDLGGRQVLRQVWTSFVKARLNCSLDAFPFDQIQSVTRVDDEIPADKGSAPDTLFYATFTAAERTPLRSSAVCVYSLAAINQLFDSGLFLEQAASGSGSWWNPTPADQVPASRPGSCQPDSRQLSDEELHFAKSHLLMAEPVHSIGGAPLLHRQGHLLTHIVADGLQKSAKDRGDVVLFVYAPDRHSVLKVLHHRPNGNSQTPIAHLLATYQFPPTKKVHAMAVLPGEYLYLGTEEQVAQFRLGQCHLYGADCVRCARDPYCSWSIARRECFPTEPAHSSAVGWIAGTGADEAAERCAKYAAGRSKQVHAFPGDAVHLECVDPEQGAPTKWTHNDVPVPDENSAHWVHSAEGGLVLLNVTDGQRGEWKCRVGGHGTGLVVAEYSLSVDMEDCARPKSVAQFQSAQREWCKRMDAYRSNLSKWQNLYESGNNDNCATRLDSQKDESGTNFV